MARVDGVTAQSQHDAEFVSHADLGGIDHTSDYHLRVARTIRDAEVGDLEALDSVYRRSALSNDADRALLLAHPEVLELTAASLDMGRTRAADIEGRIVGFAATSFRGDRLELDAQVVDPDRRRRGIAHDLMLDTVAVARAGGVDHIEVTATDARNAASPCPRGVGWPRRSPSLHGLEVGRLRMAADAIGGMPAGPRVM